MTKRLIATLLAATLALTTLAIAPARAQSGDEVGRAIAGAITLFVIGSALSNAMDRKPSKSTKKKQPAPAPTTNVYQGENFNGWNNGRGYGAAKQKPGRKAKRARTLPRECFFVLNRGREELGVFGATCLKEFQRRTDRLPAACAMTLPVRHGRKAKVYGAQCLREYGYRSARLVRD